MTSLELRRLLYNFQVRTHTSSAMVAAVALFLGQSALAQWSPAQATGSEANLRGVSVRLTNAKKYAVWASGTKGTVLRSLDEGKSWQPLKVEGGTDLDFRDIEAFDATTAYVMSSGDGDKSRIYKTTDGGNSWTLQHSDKRAGFFLDSLVCHTQTHCFALSDPVGGKFVVLSTSDGQHWKELPRDKMPAALPTEGAFAASGTSIALCGKKDIYFGSGGPVARIFHSTNQGRSWTATETPMASGDASKGIFSVACHGRSIVAVGGDYREPDSGNKVAIYSKDAGTTWHLAEQLPGSYRSGVAFLSGKDYVAVGPNGTDISHDAGVHWIAMKALNLNAITLAGTQGWAAGPKGTVARFSQHAF